MTTVSFSRGGSKRWIGEVVERTTVYLLERRGSGGMHLEEEMSPIKFETKYIYARVFKTNITLSTWTYPPSLII
jgi:hypothetical protein